MKLNPEKFAFGVESSKSLDFIVSNQGIDINPNNIKAIDDITVVDSAKFIQRLIGWITTLGRLISRSSDRSHKFYSLVIK